VFFSQPNSFLPFFCNFQFNLLCFQAHILAGWHLNIQLDPTTASQSQSHIATDGQSVSQSVSLGVEPHLGLMTRYLLLFDSYGLVSCGAPSLTTGRLRLLSLSLSLMLRPMVSRPVCLGINHPSGAYDQIFITVGQLWVC
jgi:hypothetical protein